MRLLAQLAFLAPCWAFLPGSASGWGLGLRSPASLRGARQHFCASQLVAARQDGSAVGVWWASQAQVVAGCWRAESCVTLSMEGRAGVEGGRGGAGRGHGRGGAKNDPSVGRGEGQPTRRSDGSGALSLDYPGSHKAASGVNRGRGDGIPAQSAEGQLTTKIKECRVVEELARILQEQNGVLNHVHVSAAWGCLSRIVRGRGVGQVGGYLVAELQEKTRGMLGQMGPREISNILRSKASLHDSRSLVPSRHFSPRDWKLDTDRGLLEAMQTRATATAGEFDPQAIANVLWALATMGERADRELLAAMQSRATVTAGEFKPRDVANLLRALATMGERADRGLLEAMQARATATAEEFKPPEVANLLWSLATMGETADQGLLVTMQARATETAEKFIPQAVANLLWSLATMGVRADRELLQAMKRRATAKVEDFMSQDVANVLWALATMGDRVDRGLLKAMQWRATATAGGSTPQNVANVLWALATMGERAEQRLLEAMKMRARATAGEFTPANVATVLWALAMVDKEVTVRVDRLAVRVLELRDEFSEAEKGQLHQWLLACESGLASDASLPNRVARVKQEMGEACLQAFSGQATPESRIQERVMR